MNARQAWLVQLEFSRVQTYLFAVPELKSMIGANTLLGEVLRGRQLKDWLQPSLASDVLMIHRQDCREG